MSAALLACVFVNSPLRLLHTSRCYPHSASTPERFVSCIHQRERNRPIMEDRVRRKGVNQVVMKNLVILCSQVQTRESDLKICIKDFMRCQIIVSPAELCDIPFKENCACSYMTS